jgi:hypothetical protein
MGQHVDEFRQPSLSRVRQQVGLATGVTPTSSPGAPRGVLPKQAIQGLRIPRLDDAVDDRNTGLDVVPQIPPRCWASDSFIPCLAASCVRGYRPKRESAAGAA